MKIILPLLLIFLSVPASAACRWVWTDHDNNIFTPAQRIQVCDSTLDLPALSPLPEIAPLQTPSLPSLPALPAIPPLGTTSCTTQRVYEFGRWIDKRVCR